MGNIDISSWGVTYAPNKSARVRLFCFHYAGGGASIYSKWHLNLPTDVELVAIQLPGRENRFTDKLITDLSSVVAGLQAFIKTKSDLPFAFFGHSLGSLVSFELARNLLQNDLPLPKHMFVSGQRAPAMPSRATPLHSLSDESLVQELKRYNGTPATILENQQLMLMALPIIRADAKLCELYRYQTGPTLPCPITAFTGDDDPLVNLDELIGWKEETSSTFQYTIFPGDHFFIKGNEEEILKCCAITLNNLTI